jgi:hypothetical protein
MLLRAADTVLYRAKAATIRPSEDLADASEEKTGTLF